MVKGNLSFTFRVIRGLGFNISEKEYGHVTLPFVIKRTLRVYMNGLIMNYCMRSALLGQLNYRKIRPFLWKLMGANISGKVYIGTEVWADIGNMNLITIEHGVYITNRCFLLCHQRDFSDYHVGDEYTNLPYVRKPIVLKKGCLLGSNVMVLPGVTIGEGAIIGAGSVVTKDIPAWTLAIGSPAKIIRQVPKRVINKKEHSNLLVLEDQPGK
jgi:acetyltransferase-like isoleucine patch superfamily enzyme